VSNIHTDISARIAYNINDWLITRAFTSPSRERNIFLPDYHMRTLIWVNPFRVVRTGKFKAVRVILIHANRTIEKSPCNCLNLDLLCFPVCYVNTRYLSLLSCKTCRPHGDLFKSFSADISEEKRKKNIYIYIYIIQLALEIYIEFNIIQVYRLSDFQLSDQLRKIIRSFSRMFLFLYKLTLIQGFAEDENSLHFVQGS